MIKIFIFLTLVFAVVLSQRYDLFDNDPILHKVLSSEFQNFVPSPEGEKGIVRTLEGKKAKIWNYFVAQNLCENFQSPGYATVVVHQGETIVKKAAGIADLELGNVFKKSTRFPIGSTTKAILSFVLATLVEDGLVDLDTPVIGYLPDFKMPGEFEEESATLFDFFTHHSYLNRNDYLWYLNVTTGLDDAVDKLEYMHREPFRYGFSYLNFGYSVVAEVMEAATGQTWEELVQERFFTPLEMEDSFTSIYDAIVDKPHKFAYGSGLNVEGATPVAVAMSPKDANTVLDSGIGPAGSISLSINDMEKYMRNISLASSEGFLGMDGGVFGYYTYTLRRGVFPSVFDLRAPFQLELQGYSLGWLVGTYKEHRFLVHNGGTLGTTTLIAVFPELGISVGVAHNINGGSFLSDILYALYAADTIIEEESVTSINDVCFFAGASPIPPIVYPNFPSTVTDPALYTGVFYNDAYKEAVVTAEGDSLRLKIGVGSGLLRSQSGSIFDWWVEDFFTADGPFSVEFININGQVDSFGLVFESELYQFVRQ